MARWPQARSAAVHRVFTRDGVEGFWAIMLPLPPGVQPRADIPRQMENLVDQVQPGLWQSGRRAGVLAMVAIASPLCRHVLDGPVHSTHILAYELATFLVSVTGITTGTAKFARITLSRSRASR